jgi:hypothetical protein
VADAKSTTEKPTAGAAANTNRTETSASHPKYARAAESGDPAVQRLLAEREAHLMNSQPDPDLAAQREAADRAVKDIDKRLNELGFTAE